MLKILEILKLKWRLLPKVLVTLTAAFNKGWKPLAGYFWRLEIPTQIQEVGTPIIESLLWVTMLDSLHFILTITSWGRKLVPAELM